MQNVEARKDKNKNLEGNKFGIQWKKGRNAKAEISGEVKFHTISQEETEEMNIKESIKAFGKANSPLYIVD